jgi:hypothetical protein
MPPTWNFFTGPAILFYLEAHHLCDGPLLRLGKRTGGLRLCCLRWGIEVFSCKQDALFWLEIRRQVRSQEGDGELLQYRP